MSVPKFLETTMPDKDSVHNPLDSSLSSLLERSRKNAVMSAVALPAGMALISMCIQMMQEQLVSKVRWAAEEAGILDSEALQQQRVRARRTRGGLVPETREDPFGYRPQSGENRRRRRQRREERARAEREREEQAREERERRERAREEREREEQAKAEREREEQARARREREDRDRREQERRDKEEKEAKMETEEDTESDAENDLFNLA